MRAKRGQAWGFDLIVASIIFLAGIISFYVYSQNVPGQSQEILDTLSYSGSLVANSLLSDGFPNNWPADPNSVVTIGILTDNKINDSKLAAFYDLNITGRYEETKILFNINQEYYVNLSSVPFDLPNPGDGGIGNIPPENPKNLIKTTRFTIYQNKPVTLNVYIWE